MMDIRRLVFVGASFFVVLGALAQGKVSISDVYAPIVVGVPPSDAYIGLSMLADGELRHYNYGERRLDESYYCLSSLDSGMTWRRVALPRDIPYADVRSPLTGEYLRATHTRDKVYVIRTKGGIDGDRTITQIDSKLAIMLKPPVFVDSGRRVLIGAHRVDKKGCFTYMSNDDGLTWSMSNVVTSPKHQIGGHHKGERWNHGAVEPTIAELNDGRLWMIMRTAQDTYYQSFSQDGGLIWSEPTPSPFYGTITMPTFLKLNDGRLLFFWSNTTSLPEVASAKGAWEDVFTNRNVSHVAISEDGGDSWIGMRELFLDERRNAEDFASVRGADKSVHQAQGVEVAPNKIVVSIGQHPLHRKILAFDVDWLYEKERSNNFEDSLKQWSAFRYYKGIIGHCGYNRAEMPLLIEHPDSAGAQVLKIGYTPNSSFVEDNDGALWNFPAAKNGEVELSVKIAQGAEKVDLILNDRWFNPTDTVASYECQYLVPLTRELLNIKDDKWHTVKLAWKHNQRAMLYVDGKKIGRIELKTSTLHGPSYLHLLGGRVKDEVGVLVESVKAKKE